MESNTKKSLRTALFALMVTMAVLAVVIGCLSCKNGPPPPAVAADGGPTEEELQTLEKSYWEGLLPNSNWTPQIGTTSEGDTPFLDGVALKLSITKVSDQFDGSFTLDTIEIGSGVFVVNGASGTFTSSVDTTVYQVTYSKNADGTEPVIAIYFESQNPTCYSLDD